MNVLERLASSLPHGTDMAAVGRSTKHGAGLLDAEWLLVGLPPLTEALIRAKYQFAAPHRAWAMWFMHLVGRGWHNPKRPGLVEGLSRITLERWLSGAICCVCSGVKSVVVDHRTETCPACHGAGIEPERPYVVTRKLGYSRSRANETWIARYHVCMGELAQHQAEAVAHMVRRARERRAA
jgi:hypothetical protein